MNTKTLMSLLLIVSSPLAQALTAPRVVPVKNQVGRLELGSDVQQAVQKFDPEFKTFATEDFITSVRELFAEDMPDQVPMATIADFNGDGRPDAVLIGSSHGERLTLSVLSGPQGYAVAVMDRQVLVRPQDSLFPPGVEDRTVSDESEFAVPREKGLFEYATLIPALARAPKDGAKHFKNDAVLLETFRSPAARVFRAVGNVMREWQPGR